MIRPLGIAFGLLFGAWLRAAPAEETWQGIAPFFAPPAEFAGQVGKFASPLKFYDGRPVAAREDWSRRRGEILRYWHEQMGPWPELIARPKVEVVEQHARGDLTQWRV